MVQHGERQPRIERAKRRVMVRYGTRSPDKAAFTKNVSETGMFLQTNQVMKPGTTIQVQAEFPDQTFTMWLVTRNARVLTTRPWDLGGDGQCFPLPRPHTLGEHAFGEGLLAVVPWLLTGDPIATYNAMLVLSLWIPALSMFVLARYWTGSAGAAFVAGLLFAAGPDRIADPAHPFVHGDLWAPLVLLFAHRLFAERTWRAAAALALLTSLAFLESLYQILALVLVLVPYGVALAIRYRRHARDWDRFHTRFIAPDSFREALLVKR